MKFFLKNKIAAFINGTVFLTTVLISSTAFSGENDRSSVYLFAYASKKKDGKDGLHYAWSKDKVNWYAIGPDKGYVRSDYGTWGLEKRMVNPFVIKDSKGVFHCIFSVNDRDGLFAHASSTDLVNWGRQSYIPVLKLPGNKIAYKGNVRNLEAFQDGDGWTISFQSGESAVCIITTNDFKNFTEIKAGSSADRKTLRKSYSIAGEVVEGSVTEVSWPVIENIIKHIEADKFEEEKDKVNAKSDSLMFASLKPISASVVINKNDSKKISSMLTGVFFEDLNYAADGGLYAELIQNRGFEYNPWDKFDADKNWNKRTAWSGDFRIDSIQGLHPNNPHFAVIKNSSISNEGFDGIPLVSGESYNFSVFAKGSKINVKLLDATGAILGQTSIQPGKNWKHYTAVLKSTVTTANARLEISTAGEASLDIISLFPQKTFKGRKNGLRQDLAQTISDIHPKFMRFPGGCLVHGDGIDNIYRWKNTVGPIETRKPMRNIWNYHQTMGLGYFEYFQFCEDIGAEPVPVLAAGVPCQNSRDGGAGQQFGIPMGEMDQYVQDVLDLIEYANAPANTKWGKIRAEAGHPKPFNLKYVGIGNEDMITDVFEARYTMIVEAVRKKYPDIVIIGTVGPNYEGTDYREGWELADKLKLPIVDEHYYNNPGWFINNQHFYDAYDRSKSKVYLGEYASRDNLFYNALAEALYMTGLERNGDVVSMASYAPLLAREGHTQWNPDLIYFTGTEVKPTVNYFVQKLYGENPGDIYMQSNVSLSDENEQVQKRFGVSSTVDTTSGDMIIKLVNMLPVPVTPKIDLNHSTNGAVSYTLMTGKPTGKSARPVVSQIELAAALKKELPAYSFVVIRIKSK